MGPSASETGPSSLVPVTEAFENCVSCINNLLNLYELLELSIWTTATATTTTTVGKIFEGSKWFSNLSSYELFGSIMQPQNQPHVKRMVCMGGPGYNQRGKKFHYTIPTSGWVSAGICMRWRPVRGGRKICIYCFPSQEKGQQKEMFHPKRGQELEDYLPGFCIWRVPDCSQLLWPCRMGTFRSRFSGSHVPDCFILVVITNLCCCSVEGNCFSRKCFLLIKDEYNYSC